MTAKVWSDKKCTATLSGHSDALMAVAIQPEAEGGVTRKAFRASQCEGVSVWGSFSGAGAGTLHFLEKKTMMNTDQYIPVLVGEVVPTMASHSCTSMDIIKVRKYKIGIPEIEYYKCLDMLWRSFLIVMVLTKTSIL